MSTTSPTCSDRWAWTRACGCRRPRPDRPGRRRPTSGPPRLGVAGSSQPIPLAPRTRKDRPMTDLPRHLDPRAAPHRLRPRGPAGGGHALASAPPT
jgi:hypothetical protein